MKEINKNEIKLVFGGDFICVCENEKNEEISSTEYVSFDSCRELCCEKNGNQFYRVKHHLGYTATYGMCIGYTLSLLSKTGLESTFMIKIKEGLTKNYYN